MADGDRITKSGGDSSSEGSDKAAEENASLEGEPISMINGEELLTLTDFVFEGPLPLIWQRTYRSSNPYDVGLGVGWTHPLCETVTINDDGRWFFHEREGRTIYFNPPKVGNKCLNRTEKLVLLRQSHTDIVIMHKSGYGIRKIFRWNK